MTTTIKRQSPGRYSIKRGRATLGEIICERRHTWGGGPSWYVQMFQGRTVPSPYGQRSIAWFGSLAECRTAAAKASDEYSEKYSHSR